mmetsp:Transcript_17132/g.54752  ORF Transcript_17132/g.54752 Transcript_17132/m.54752 type:complete len:138 (-) Transcript_17132:81-494(-)
MLGFGLGWHLPRRRRGHLGGEAHGHTGGAWLRPHASITGLRKPPKTTRIRALGVTGVVPAQAADRIKARAAEATKWTKDVSVRASTFTSFDVDVRERLFKEYSALAAAASPVLRERGAGIGRSIFSAVIPATTPVIG